MRLLVNGKRLITVEEQSQVYETVREKLGISGNFSLECYYEEFDSWVELDDVELKGSEKLRVINKGNNFINFSS